MACFHPIEAYQERFPNKEGKRPIHFHRVRVKRMLVEIKLPCGSCTGCLLERSRQWAVRCLHEKKMHRESCMVTLTYNDEHLPWAGSLHQDHFVRFMKRLRKRFVVKFPNHSPAKPFQVKEVRVFYCGEYGDLFGRPHYHALLFGMSFPDQIFLGKSKGLPLWRSPLLEELWPFGRSSIGTVTFESAAYVARYVLKKVRGPKADEHYGLRDPEFVAMSRRPGIGSRWLEAHHSEVYPLDGVVVRGRLAKPPRYYDRELEKRYPEGMEWIRAKRVAEVGEEMSEQERSAMAENVVARTNLYKRGGS